LSEPPFFHHSLKIPAVLSAVDSSRELSVHLSRAAAGIQANQHIHLTEPVSSEQQLQRRLPYSLDRASGIEKQVSPHLQQCLHYCEAGHLLEEPGSLMLKDCLMPHSSSPKHAARSRSSAPSAGAQSHLPKLFTIRGNTAAMTTHYSGKMALEQ